MPPKKLVVKNPVVKPDDVDSIIDMDEDDELYENIILDKKLYNQFIEDTGINILDSNYYTNNDIHKEIALVPREYRITSEIMTKAEYARVISERAKQIEDGAFIFIEIANEYDPVKIAEKEIIQKKCPIKISRKITKNVVEEWSVNEMIIPFGVNL